MAKPVILTGLRANNDLHIGNYFGALLPLIDMAKNRSSDYQINLFVPDLHSFTTPIDHTQLQAQIMHNLKLFVAAGLPLDDENIHIYRQSYIPAHSELTWILDCFTGFGEMSRMTQFKDKAEAARATSYNKLSDTQQKSYNTNAAQAKAMRRGSEDNDSQFADMIRDEADQFDIQNEIMTGRATVGLFNYPVLMAADILLYGAEYVPVGDDQSQHLEFTRDIAERMNNKFGQLFVVPKPVKQQHEFFGKEQGLRIKDLQNPSRKMSKSDETGKGIIFLGDSPEAAAKKIKSAETDSLSKIDPKSQDQPGIANLLQILSLATNRPPGEVTNQYQGQTQYGPLKNAVAEAVANLLADFQARLAQVDETALKLKLEQDEARLNEIANQCLLRVQKAVGLR